MPPYTSRLLHPLIRSRTDLKNHPAGQCVQAFFFCSPPSYLCLRFSATVNNIFRDNETHRARQRKKGRGEAGKDTHHYLNLTALKVGLGFQTPFAPQSNTTPKKKQETARQLRAPATVDLSCLFLNTLAVAPEALEHGPSLRYW